MPPHALAIALTILTASLLFRLSLVRHGRLIKQLPFITDITQGVCPRCGEHGPEAETITAEPASFWRGFACACGFTVRTHLRGA